MNARKVGFVGDSQAGSEADNEYEFETPLSILHGHLIICRLGPLNPSDLLSFVMNLEVGEEVC